MSTTALMRDSMWDMFPNTECWDIFKTHYIPELFLTQKVSEGVQRDFELIEQAMSHSYFAYNFLELVRTKALLTFEGALKSRYLEETGKEPEGDLQQLINFFHAGNYFEGLTPDLPQWIKTSRNYHAHGHGNWPGFPPMTQRTVKQVLYSINDLYEDRILRRTRKQIRKKIEKAITRLTHPVLCSQEGIVPLHNARYIFLDNKQEQPRLTLGFSQVSLLKKAKDGHPAIGVWTKDFTDEVQILEDRLRLKDYSTGEIYEILEGNDDFTLTMKQSLNNYLLNEKNREFYFHLMDVGGWFTDIYDSCRLKFYKSSYR